MFHFGTNLKMNHTVGETVRLVAGLRPSGVRLLRSAPQVGLWVAPSYTAIEAAARAAGGDIRIGAQNVHWAEGGAHTGEISAPQLRDCGASFVLLGHVERRRDFGETDEVLNLKARACRRAGLDIMLCVGEARHEARRETVAEHLHRQLCACLKGLAAPEGLVILYEPAQSVGPGGAAADCGDVEAAFASLRGSLAALFGSDGQEPPLLYGGSVTAGNAAAYAAVPGCSGIGVGRAAWTVDGFTGVLGQALRGIRA